MGRANKARVSLEVLGNDGGRGLGGAFGAEVGGVCEPLLTAEDEL